MPGLARELDLRDPGVRRAWAALVEAAPDPSPFAPLDYAEAAGRAFGLRPVALGVVRDGALAAGVVAYEKRRGPYRLAVVPPLTPTTPFVLAEPPAEAEVHARASLLDVLIDGLAGRFHAQAFRLQPSLTDVRPFTWAGYTAEPRYTYARAFQSPEDVLASAGRGVRKRMRRDAGGFELREEPGRLDALGRLEAEGYARQGTAPPVRWDRQAALYRAVLASGRARLFVLHDADGPAAAQAVVRDGRSAVFVNGASRPGPAMTVLTVRVGERLVGDGVRRIDLGGANMASIAEFKRGFGMPFVTSFAVTRIGRPGLRAVSLLRPVV